MITKENEDKYNKIINDIQKLYIYLRNYFELENNKYKDDLYNIFRNYKKQYINHCFDSINLLNKLKTVKDFEIYSSELIWDYTNFENIKQTFKILKEKLTNDHYINNQQS